MNEFNLRKNRIREIKLRKIQVSVITFIWLYIIYYTIDNLF